MLLSIALAAWTEVRADFVFDAEVFLKNVRMSSMLGVTSSGSKVFFFLVLMGVDGVSEVLKFSERSFECLSLTVLGLPKHLSFWVF